MKRRVSENLLLGGGDRGYQIEKKVSTSFWEFTSDLLQRLDTDTIATLFLSLIVSFLKLDPTI